MVEQPMHVLVPDRGLVFDAEARLCAAVRGTQTPDLRILVDIYSLDHPVHPGLPETAYLKAMTLQID